MRLIVPLFLGAALAAQTLPDSGGQKPDNAPQNYQRQELSPQQKQALLDFAHRQQARQKVIEKNAQPADQPCAIPLVNALRPDAPVPFIRRVPVPEGMAPMPEAKVPPVCPERK